MNSTQWIAVEGFEDILYHKSPEGIARVCINRPHVRNAFRPQTVQEMMRAFADIRDDQAAGGRAKAEREGSLVARCGSGAR